MSDNRMISDENQSAYREGEPNSEPSVRIVPLTFCFVLAAAALVGLGAAVYLGVRGLWLSVYLVLLGAALAAFFAKMLWNSAFFFVRMYRNAQHDRQAQPHLDFVLHEELLNRWSVDDRISEALVSLDGWTTSNPQTPGFSYWLGANLVLRRLDEHGRLLYIRTFPFRREEDAALLSEVLLRLQSSGAAVYRTDLNLNELNVRDLAEAYESLPKSAYDFQQPFEIGKQVREPQFSYPYRTPEMLARKQNQRRRNDTRFFRPVYIVGLVVNLLLALIWIPFWIPQNQGKGFVWETDWHSGALALQLLNITVFIVAGRYWRDTSKRAWRPLRDAACVLAIHMAGLMLAGSYQAGTWGKMKPLAILDLLLAVCLIIAYAFIRTITRKQRLHATSASVDANGQKAKAPQPRKYSSDRVLRPLFVAVLAANFLMAWLLMPNWRYDADAGGYEPLGMYMLATAALLTIAGAYWRKETKGLTPFYAAASVFIVQFIGAMLGLPQEVVWGQARDSLFMNLLSLLIVLYVIFAVLKGIGFLVRKSKADGRD
ncbi:hypothetical protein [Saccharibacillus sacchari]|uniref:Uncharacterized protein n=1 Tax=Saccharibacillus sacchari TaxID=456493 RepID=A0ACC6P8K8_9BACL